MALYARVAIGRFKPGQARVDSSSSGTWIGEPASRAQIPRRSPCTSFLGILDPALQELFALNRREAQLRLENELVLATLFTSGIKMPDVFLFNNSALHDHVLGTKYRSLFSELLDRNVVQVVARSQEARDFQSMLRTVKDDTLSGVALPHAVAIQATADGAAERLGGVADRQKPGYLPSVGATSSGIALAQSLRDRCTTLERSNNPIDRRVVAVPRAEAASQAGRRAAERVARRLRRLHRHVVRGARRVVSGLALRYRAGLIRGKGPGGLIGRA